MHITEHIIAVRDRLNNDPDSTDIVYFVNALILRIHFAINAVNMLYARGNGVFDAAVIQLFADGLLDAFKHFLVLILLTRQSFDYFLVADRIQPLQRKILQLPFNLLHAEAMGNRRINLHRFERFGALLLLLHELNRAHIVQAVGELDEDDANVLRHGDQHFAQILHLLLFLGVVQASQTCDTVDKIGNRGAELLLNLIILEVGVLHAVVQQAGTDRVGIQSHLNDNFRDRNRMNDIGIAVFALLSLVRRSGTFVGQTNFLDICGGILLPHAVD